MSIAFFLSHVSSSGLRRRRGFTLIEVLIGVFILTLVVSAVYFTLYTALEAFHAGTAMMDQYQETRVGLSRMLTDLRQAASPNQYWQDLKEHEQRLDEDGNPIPIDPDIDKDRGKIKLVGDANKVSFVLREVVPQREKPYDLVEVRYELDRDKQAVLRTRARSVLANQMVMWRENLLSTLYETDFRNTLPDAVYEPYTEEVIHNVLDLQFRYFDGENWVDTWDSSEPLVEEEEEAYDPLSGNPTPTPDPNRLEKGLPAAVQVQLGFFAETRSTRRQRSGKDLLRRSLITSTYLPHSNLNLAETPFSSKEGKRGMRSTRRTDRSDREQRIREAREKAGMR